jgi:nucleotide-binding universal stress UspA family protein
VTDGSDTSKRSVDHAMDLSRKYNAKLVMLHVLNLLIPRGSVSLISDKLHEEDRRKTCILLEGALGLSLGL